jgi:hypothetical protein
MMTRPIELPGNWTAVLERIRSVLPSAYLAGGAIRDFDNARPVKDFDVFFTEGFDNINYLEDKLKDLYIYKSECPGQYMGGGAASEVGGTMTFNSIVGLPELNLILLDKSFNPTGIIERVDFGLCQIGADCLGVEYTPAYAYDRDNQCLTLTRAESVEGVARSLKRYARLSQKYVGWELNVPAEFAALVAAARDMDKFVTAVEETF